MKKYMFFVLVTIFLAVGKAHAQSNPISADIPFDFVVGNSTFHGGTYTIRPNMNGSFLQLRSADQTQVAFLLPFTCSSEMSGLSESKIVFRTVGSHHYLWQIWTQGYRTGWEIPAKFKEQDLATAQEFKPEVVLASIAR